MELEVASPPKVQPPVHTPALHVVGVYVIAGYVQAVDGHVNPVTTLIGTPSDVQIPLTLSVVTEIEPAVTRAKEAPL